MATYSEYFRILLKKFVCCHSLATLEETKTECETKREAKRFGHDLFRSFQQPFSQSRLESECFEPVRKASKQTGF